MKNRNLLIGGFGIVILLLLYYIATKEAKQDAKGKGTIDTIPPPPPTTLSIGSSNGNNNNKPLDPTSGEGLRTIEAYAKTLFKDKDLMSKIKKENGIGAGYFSGITPAKTGIYLQSKIYSQLGINQDSEIPIVPKFLDGGKFLDDITAFRNYVKNPRPKIDLDIQGTRNEIYRLGNFMDTAGFIISPSETKSSNDLEVAGFSKCNQAFKGKRNECKRDHWEDYGKQLYKIAAKIKSDTEKFNDVLFDYTAQVLTDNGWKFIGYIPTINI